MSEEEKNEFLARILEKVTSYLPGILHTLLDMTQSPSAIIREGGVSATELETMLHSLGPN